MTGNQKKIPVESSVEVFFGYSSEGNLRLSFMSTISPPFIESTNILHVVQGRENQNTYWTSFDLLNTDLKEAYFSFCENMIEVIVGIEEESTALNMLRRRFLTWRKLFRKVATKEVSKEKLMGLFGELTVLKDIISPQYDVKTAIQAWGGPDMQSKDFTLSNTWYEVKTIGSNADSIQISSLSQLSSDQIGHLVVVRVETVSNEYTGKCSAIIDIVKEILQMLSDEGIEDLFIGKIKNIGIDVLGKETSIKFDVKSIKSYKVTDDFPKITRENVPYPEITDVKYTISISAIDHFAEE